MLGTAIIGMACRLPGASDAKALWRVLKDGVCTVAPAPSGRWLVERFLHPRSNEAGFSYTFAGGFLEDPFGFDPLAFGISPREAAQIDPQQRLLLEVVWEALEDAGIAPSSLAGEAIGVYVGASSVDYQNAASVDHAVIESHFVTGIALSIISNRISYVFDWKGPSLTVDTACSSSIVALSQALDAIESGRIDTAVVAGVNMLLSPAPFIGFSRARMLSPTGLCRPFSAAADGYVRAEGAVALVLRRQDLAQGAGDRIRSLILGAGVNSDGRTVGVSLPSVQGQASLLERLYDGIGLDPARLAFVEAHGTGTPVGDPIEARAIGQALGRHRTQPLPVGSVKSNIGHLESASGLAGVAKTILALEHGLYPRTLHLDRVNPNIPFEEIGLVPAETDVAFAIDDGPALAGVCNYGFGGTNAHVVLSGPPAVPQQADGAERQPLPARSLVLSARSADALAALAGRYAEQLEAPAVDVDLVARAAARQRDWLEHRVALPLAEPTALAGKLRRLAAGEEVPGLARAEGATTRGVALVFPGNGCQWPGMGVAAYARNQAFRDQLAEIDGYFQPLAGWSLIEAMHAEDLPGRLAKTSTAQPLVFAIQSALAAVLRANGLTPACVLGHSVGEVAAAEAAGAFSREDAVRLVFERSRHQEAVFGRGGMMVVGADESVAGGIVAQIGRGLEIAAVNAPGSVTVSGPDIALEALSREARRRRIATIRLDIRYPFHSSIFEGSRDALIAGLGDIRGSDCPIPFISAVTGARADGSSLDAEYWWRNVRQPVHFRDATEAASELGIDLFVELSPRPILVGAVAETVRAAGRAAPAIGSLTERDADGEIDPIEALLERLLVRGALGRPESRLGTPPRRRVPLPHYPWQRVPCCLPETREGIEAYGRATTGVRHPLLGTRMAHGSPEWRMLLDAEIVPYLRDHKVGDDVIVPGAALIEIVLAVGRTIHGEGPLEIEDFDIFRALVLPEEGMRELSVRYDDETCHVEIRSRPRFGEEWSVNARGRVTRAVPAVIAPLAGPQGPDLIENSADEIYAAARRSGLNYGPAFQRVVSLVRDAVSADARLAPAELDIGAFRHAHVLDPTALDAAFHGLFVSREQREGEVKAHLPVRIRRLRLMKPDASPVRAIVRLVRETARSKTVDAALLDADGEVVAEIERIHLKSVVLSRTIGAERILRTGFDLVELNASRDRGKVLTAAAAASAPPASWLLMRAFAMSLAHRSLAAIAAGGPLVLAEAVADGRLQASAQELAGQALRLLAAANLASAAGDAWTIAAETPFPEPELLISTLAERFPGAQADLLLALGVLSRFDDRLRRREASLTADLASLFEAEGAIFGAGVKAIEASLDALVETLAPRKPRVMLVEPWSRTLLDPLLRQARRGAIDLVLAGFGHASAPQELRSTGDTAVHVVDLLEQQPEALRFRPADVLVAHALTPLLDSNPARLARIKAVMADGAVALVLQPPEDPALDLLLALKEGSPARLPSLAETSQTLTELGFAVAMHDGVEHSPLAPRVLAGVWRLKERRAASLALTATAVEVAGDADPALTEILRFAPASDTEVLVDLPAATAAEDADPQHLSRRALRLSATLKQLLDDRVARPLVVVTRGALGVTGEPSPGADAIWSFGRVAINEYPSLDIRLVDLAPDLEPQQAVARLTEVLSASSGEAELLVGHDRVWAPRILRGPQTHLAAADAEHRTRLVVEAGAGRDSFAWEAQPRLVPQAGEVEIAVEATGLNFRDVMISLGLLDEDLLGAGLTAAALGFECAGRIARVGSGVTGFEPGDLVIGFAADAFASHVTVSASAVAKAPEGLSAEAAATIPVAFSTAWFALNDVARLRAGETVLIHAAVGGVGMAAVQIAKMAGAKVIATAGSDDRRRLALALGADAVYDSRSLEFAERIREQHGQVDVVLNSLAGEAMRSSLRLLRPFGRFVELGKRDYMNNSALELRPFVRNLAYFGVDLDELLAHDRAAVDRVMAAVGAAIASGDLKPLPYRVFEGDQVDEAFRLMQRAGHVGKIVVRPSATGVLPETRQAFVPAPGVHVVVGGTGGLGLETAIRIADRGAERVVVASRGGVRDPEVERRIAAYDGRIVAAKVDATDERAVAAFLDEVRRAHGPIAGIVHTAMVLQDGLIDGLTPETLDPVLAPKVIGAAALDRATENDDLQYFVVYSSATTVIGSPGQGAYVLANGFLEGLVRARRARGKPGLALAWGSISDVGVVARDKSLGQRLSRTTGVSGVSSRDALDHLEQMLARGNEAGPVEVYSAMGHSAVAEKLALLKTPAFALFGTAAQAADESGTLDLTELIAGKSDSDALDELVAVTRAEIGRILRIEPDRIDPTQALSDVGMDSLMALELRLNFEKRCGIELPLLSLGDKSARHVAERILHELRSASNGLDGTVARGQDGTSAILDDDADISGIVEILDASEVRAVAQRGVV